MAKRGRKSGLWTVEFDEWLRARHRSAALSEAIPASRDLAKIHGVNHTTVFRHLLRLVETGLLWQAPNGRIYFREARAALEKPRPVACLLRKIENWSLLYQELMEGIARECEQQALGTLLWHEDQLVRHIHPASPPEFASVPRQIDSLARFAERYGGEVGGLILDHVWHEEAVATLPAELKKHAVLLCRPGSGEVPAAYPDFPKAAVLAFRHLGKMGYQTICPVRPFPNDPSVEYCLEALESAPITTIASPRARRQLIDTLARRPGRSAVLFPEDNSALHFWRECLAAGLACPGKVGIVSLQGTRAAAAGGLTHIRTDYAALGQRAVQMCLHLRTAAGRGSPALVAGASTASKA